MWTCPPAPANQSAVSSILTLLFFAAGLAGLVASVAATVGVWRSVYGITDRRILVVEQRLRKRVRSWTPQQITTIERRDRANGRGDIVFHQSQRPSGDGSELVSAELSNIADVRAVEALVRDLAVRALHP